MMRTLRHLDDFCHGADPWSGVSIAYHPVPDAHRRKEHIHTTEKIPAASMFASYELLRKRYS